MKRNIKIFSIILCLFSSLTLIGNEASIYQGKIGDFDIYMEITNNNGVLIGWYEYPRKSTKLRLEGTLSNSGSLEIFEYNYKAKKTGLFKGYLKDDNSIKGIWTNPKETKRFNFLISLSNNKTLVDKIIESKPKPKIVSGDKDLQNKSPIKTNSFVFIISIITLILLGYILIKIYRKKVSISEANKSDVTGEDYKNPKTIDSKFNESEISKSKGNLFENYVGSLFTKNEKYFTIIDATSDRKIGGKYVKSNSNPDLKIQFKNNGVSEVFAVECKYRSSFNETVIKDIKQLNNYLEYASAENIKVFVALGIGGYPNKPAELFIIPIEEISCGVLNRNELLHFLTKRDYLFFDVKEKTLK